MPGQWRMFWDSTTALWTDGELNEKYVGMFTSTGTLGGGHELTPYTSLPCFVHHGMIFVPLGYKHAMTEICDMQSIHGGSPWGAGTFTDNDGLREPSEIELKIANIQGERFYKIVSRAYP
ncbi:hypothetical protein FF38_00924 [Lucilia cuprina]|uniref:Uncharacterized protein n=1 Tax=Lucilia cuprina TaxID=7375 RepID=A0A0L0CMQ8_LUCCU|nr:hypothetical protein FF38_00924 [Lucilia cuprina]